MKPFSQTLIRAVSAAVLLAPLAVAAPALAAEQAPQATAGKATHAMKKQESRVETRIATLHKELRITPAQEAQWNAVAQIMRDDVKTHDDLVAAKHAKAATMSATDDLNAYAEIAQAHADGVKKLAAAFQTLYASMSDSQKKLTDEVFRAHKRRMRAKMHQQQPAAGAQ
ncbi:hypothetical protein GALL_176190 [mine drainage metagenome]|uniref:LTXXQ motif family protein n=1 Tax=mine drainage metagenome TaxID=410659 RepID=A0A1J5SJS6_9ZZZZ